MFQSQEMNNKLTIGFITYDNLTAKYLPYFLISLKKQTFKDINILLVDNSEIEENENKIYINKIYPEININRSGKNLGFAKAYNIMISKAIKEQAEYFFAVNPDTLLDERSLEIMIKALASDKALGSVAPKILKWDFKNLKKTKIIDSCGITLLPGLKFNDLGQGEPDNGQYDRSPILGPTGAAGIYRISALEIIKDHNGYFDENMFMYKEDCDLAYRLSLAGFKSKLIPDAIIYHDRSAAGQGNRFFSIIANRKNKSRKVNEWSFINQQLIFWKFWRTIDWKNKLAIVSYQLKILFYILMFEPCLLNQLFILIKKRRKVKKY